ncbi:ribonuclease HII [soil metagenome]
MKQSKSLPDFSYENELYKKGFKFIGGVDEVGRGAFAGPVVAACVVFKENTNIKVLINDSKKLSSKQRELANHWIKNNAQYFGIGSASSGKIDKVGIKKTTEIAMRQAIKNCHIEIEHLLVDAFYIPKVKSISKNNQTPIIKGDSKSFSIAAASIIAKVYRDKLMTTYSLNPKYKNYNWGKNKGYGTLDHRIAIKKYGKSRLHRVSFLLNLS